MRLDHELQRAALLGVAGGLRTFMPPAALVVRQGRPSGRAGTALVVAAAGELIGDKLPQMPSRTDSRGLAARFTSSGACGFALAGPRGAGVAGASAMAGAFAGFHARRWLGRRTGWPDPACAVVEDGVAVGLAALGTRR